MKKEFLNSKKLQLLIGICFLSMGIIGCNGGKDSTNETLPNTEKEIAEDVESPSEDETTNNILKATAKDANDLTGTYVDEELQEQIIVIQTDDGITYSYGVIDDTEPIIETNCTLKDNYFGGMLYYIGRNMDGTLNISSGAGGYWGSFAKISDEAVIDMALASQSEDMSEADETTYNNETVNPRLQELRNMASIANCATDIITEEGNYGSPGYTKMDDDYNYFDEIVLGVWFDENGNPKADLCPSELGYLLFHDHHMSGSLENFHFINSENYTMDMVKRAPVKNDYADTYAFVLPNISKETDGYGNDYIIGYEYTSSCAVVVHHNMSGILNGDTLLVIAKFTGLASDDTPNFEMVYAENLNNRF